MNQQIQNELNNTSASAPNNQAQTNFLNNISHDILTPMNAIIGYTNMALKYTSEPMVRECLKKIEESSDHLLTLLRDVLDFSRIESENAVSVSVPVNINTLTYSVIEDVQNLLAGRQLKLIVKEKPSENPYVLADSVRIRKILGNILNNAVKFTRDGGEITFSAEYIPGKDKEHILGRYTVSDTGIGMSKAFQAQMFEPFSQEECDARTIYQGTGLGLAIVKRYVDIMDGTISVKSKKGEGSAFTVELPLELADFESDTEHHHPGHHHPAVINNMAGLHILIAEDNDLNAEIAAFQLEEIGMKVTRAVDGKEALETFSDYPAGTFDAILMDIRMPRMNGYDAAKAIRNLKNRPDGRSIPIFAMTANAFAEDVQASFDAGMNGHLSKPMVMDEVIKMIAGTLNFLD